MRERVPYGEEDRQCPAEPPARTDHPSVLILQLQQAAGNQATARLLQRFGVTDIIVGPGLTKVRASRFGHPCHHARRRRVLNPDASGEPNVDTYRCLSRSEVR